MVKVPGDSHRLFPTHCRFVILLRSLIASFGISALTPKTFRVVELHVKFLYIPMLSHDNYADMRDGKRLKSVMAS